MHRHVRMAKLCGAVLAATALLLPGAPAAGADETRPKPPPINLLSATVKGCDAPCAPDESGEVTIKFDPPVRPEGVPAGAFTHIRVTADGQGFHWFSSSTGPGPWEYKFRICSSGGSEPYPCVYQRSVDLQGDEAFAVSVGFSWDCDPILAECASSSRMSEPSNTLVPTQL